MLTTNEQRVLQTFRKFRVPAGKMLCFYGPTLKRHKAALRQLTEKELLIKEQFEGGYSLTATGFAAMRSCG